MPFEFLQHVRHTCAYPNHAPTDPDEGVDRDWAQIAHRSDLCSPNTNIAAEPVYAASRMSHAASTASRIIGRIRREFAAPSAVGDRETRDTSSIREETVAMPERVAGDRSSQAAVPRAVDDASTVPVLSYHGAAVFLPAAAPPRRSIARDRVPKGLHPFVIPVSRAFTGSVSLAVRFRDIGMVGPRLIDSFSGGLCPDPATWRGCCHFTNGRRTLAWAGVNSAEEMSLENGETRPSHGRA